MRRHYYIAYVVFTVLASSTRSLPQETIFNGLRTDLKRADAHFQKGSYKNAVGLYLSAEKKDKDSKQIYLKLGKTYLKLKDYENSVLWYGNHLDNFDSLPISEVLNYAEALQSVGDYEKAIDYYQFYLENHPDDARIVEKIWRLSNIQFLLEDSMYYAVKQTDINPNESEHSPVFYQNGLIFVSHKSHFGGISNINALDNTPFTTLYFVEFRFDTLAPASEYNFNKMKEFSKDITSRYNIGPVSFFPDQKKMIFTKNGVPKRGEGSTLQLCIAQQVDDTWREVESVSFNSTRYSVSHPALNKDGTVLYFASDMPGGFGGTDLYVSYFRTNTWTKPENLGNIINTGENETSPYIHNGALYFASDGHSGLGGLDIFKVNIKDISPDQIINLGYPINSSFDDFGIALNEEGSHGFISSNRGTGGFDDQIYDIEIDLQSYPLTITGLVKFKELTWKDINRFEFLPNADLYLIDIHSGKQVGESKTDSKGNFAIDIPYASQYAIKIIEPSIGEITVSLEIPKNKKSDARHDIVIVKNSSHSLDKIKSEPGSDIINR